MPNKEKYYSVRGFVVHTERVLLQSIRYSSNNAVVDSCGSFVDSNENRREAIRLTVEEQTGLAVLNDSIEEAAIVNYTIHKSDSNNNKVETTVFILHLDDRLNPKVGEPWKWYKYEEIPYSKIYPDVKLWLPRLLEGQRLRISVEVDQAEEYTKSKIINSSINRATF